MASIAAGRGVFTRQLGWISAAAAAGLYQAGNQIKNTAEELVPIDTGTLKGSARVLEPELEGDTITCVVGFGYGTALNPKTGDKAAAYAFIVEQNEDAHHPHGQAHFLRDAALRHLPGLPGDVAVSIQVMRKSGFFRRFVSGSSLHITTERIT